MRALELAQRTVKLDTTGSRRYIQPAIAAYAQTIALLSETLEAGQQANGRRSLRLAWPTDFNAL